MFTKHDKGYLGEGGIPADFGGWGLTQSVFFCKEM